MTEQDNRPRRGVVEARFVCRSLKVQDQTSSQVLLDASTAGRDNTDWAPYTPAGHISMTVNGPVGAEFVAGARYRVLFERLPDDEPPQAT